MLITLYLPFLTPFPIKLADIGPWAGDRNKLSLIVNSLFAFLLCFNSTFSEWEVNGDEKYGFMKFEKGVHCWNGPDRSAKVSPHNTTLYYLFCQYLLCYSHFSFETTRNKAAVNFEVGNGRNVHRVVGT